jgi:hypothetical protein
MKRFSTLCYSLALGFALCMLNACERVPEKQPVVRPAEPEPVQETKVVEGPPPKSEWQASASGVQEEVFPASAAIDGKRDTRWSSPAADPQWLQVDLGREAVIAGLTIYWEAAFSSAYHVDVSKDGADWETVYANRRADGNTDEVYFTPVIARYFRITGTKRATGWGHSIWEVEVKGPDEQIHIMRNGEKVQNGQRIFDGKREEALVLDGELPLSLEFDLGTVKGTGGIRIDWGEGYAEEADVALSRDGAQWETVGGVTEGTGKFDVIMHARKEARYIRLTINEAAGAKPPAITEITLRGPNEVMSPLALFQLAAEKAEAGVYPDHLRRRQVYWTLSGLPRDSEESLLDEYGNLEPTAGSPSVMPYIYLAGEGLITALDADDVSQSLVADYLPVPSVAWRTPRFKMDVEAITRGTLADSATYVRYTIENTGEEVLSGRFYLAVRPVQINPDWQHGGLAPIRSIAFSDESAAPAVLVNDKPFIYTLTPAETFGARAFERGDIGENLVRDALPPVLELKDAGDYLSGALAWTLNVPSGGKQSFVVAAPLHDSTVDIQSFTSTGNGQQVPPPAAFTRHKQRVVNAWRKQIDRVKIGIPQKEVIDTMMSQVGYILINQDGVSIQPGSRNYKRAWIRDGGLTSAALLRMGLFEPVRDYLAWYADRVQPNGWVPPILNNDGTINKGFGWDNEYDSQGEFVFIMMDYYRFTRDREFLAEHFDEMVAALKYLVELRNKTLEPGYMSDHEAPERFRGILPKSISHEGYSPPMHSHWDNFWALKGWKDGEAAARVLGREDIAEWASEQYGIFRESMLDSILATVELKGIDYVPGCAEKGDLDPTSTAISFFPCGEGDLPPADIMQNTFDRYYSDLISRLEPGWVGGFTPYEIRSVMAFVKLDQRERAKVLLDYMLSCRRPAAWNHLAEVVHSDPRKGSYIGDMPHTWVGSGYINSVRGMLVYETADDLVLLDGAAEEWVRGDGIRIADLPTHFGKLNLAAVMEGQALNVNIGGELNLPGRIVLRWPVDEKPSSVTVDGEAWSAYDDKRCVLPATARRVRAEW